MGEKVVDMTQGSIMPKILRFALPVLLGMLCQRVYNFADVYIVGKYLGDEALASVSIAGSAMYLLMSMMMGITTGVSVVMSQYYGAGETDKVSDTFVTSIYVAGLSVIVITIAGVLGTQPLLQLLQTSEKLIENAKIYLVIIFIGSFGTMLYNWVSAILRSLGNSVVPVVFLIISSVLNVVLDIAFVAWIPMGVAGAAIATVLAQVISGVLCLMYAWKILPILRLTRKNIKMDPEIAKLILIYGLPTGLQMGIISISDMTLQAVVNTYETALVVAYGICKKVEGLGWQIADAIGTSLGTFVGQNIGAGKIDRVKKGVNYGYLLNLLCYGVFCPIVLIYSQSIMKAFTEDPASIRYGMEYMRIFTGFFFFGGFLGIYHNVLRSAGDVKVTILMGLSEVITRIGFSFLFNEWFGYYGLWWVSPITWCCATMVGGVRYYSGTWQNKARIQKKEG